MKHLEKDINKPLRHLISKEMVKASINILMLITTSRALYKKFRVKRLIKQLPLEILRILKKFNTSFQRIEQASRN
ncbi:MAG: hypothetical protein DRO15_08190 [Thermoprotei archaeon]|nr:MAG: hypothetical protein DRO15_08190 [Thermoprotei archaeon]